VRIEITDQMVATVTASRSLRRSRRVNYSLNSPGTARKAFRLDDLLDPNSFLEPWYKALASPRGIELRCTGPREAAIQKLYQARVRAKDGELKKLSIHAPPEDSSLIWIRNV